MTKQEIINIYTDGSCIEKDGGWAILVLFDDNIGITISGREQNTTNNRMELKAVIAALNFILENDFCNINTIIHTDSMLTLNCAQEKWQRRANMDMWQEYDSLSPKVKIEYNWVKAHSGITHNEFVDKESRKQSLSLK